MFHLFRTSDSRGEEVAEATRRHDEAFDDLKEVLHRLLAERNHDGRAPGRAAEERRQ